MDMEERERDLSEQSQGALLLESFKASISTMDDEVMEFDSGRRTQEDDEEGEESLSSSPLVDRLVMSLPAGCWHLAISSNLHVLAVAG